MAAATLRLTRHRRFFGRRQAWRIQIDGSQAGSIADGESVIMPVEAGQHALRLRAGQRFASPERIFTAAAGSEVSFSCHSPLIWPQAEVALAVPGLWIGLKRD